MVALDLAVGTPAGQALWTTELLRAEILRAVERDQNAATEPLEGREASLLAQNAQGLIKGGLQVRGRHRVEHGPDMVVGRDGRHAEQAAAVRRLAAGLKLALVGEKRLALHEEQRKGRQADVRHAVFHVATPLVGKGRTCRSHAVQKGFQHLHAGLHHISGQNETHPP